MEKDSVTPQDVEQAMADSPEAVADEALLQQIAGEDIDAQLSTLPQDGVEPIPQASTASLGPAPAAPVQPASGSVPDNAVSDADMAALKAVVVTEPNVASPESEPAERSTPPKTAPFSTATNDVSTEEDQGGDLDSQLAALQQVVREVANADDEYDPFVVSLEAEPVEPMGSPDEMFKEEQINEDEAIVEAELDASAEITVVEEVPAGLDEIEEIQVARPLRLSAPLIKVVEWLDHPLANISAENRMLIGLIGIITAAMAITSWIISIVKG